MPASKRKYAQPEWPDLAEAVPQWEADLGIELDLVLRLHPNLVGGGYVTVVAYDRSGIGRGAELYRVRAAFPATRGGGHASAVMAALFQLIREMEASPWYWSSKMRAARVKPATD